MALHNPLLIEIGTEELPPKSLKRLGYEFAQNVHNALIKQGFSPEAYEWFASPRRIAVLVSRVATKQPDQIIEKKGPAVSAAFDGEGNPTKAAIGWARANGISVEEAERLVSEKGEWLLHKAEIPGKSIEKLVTQIVENSLNSLPIAKHMRWGNENHHFVRPVHTYSAMLGEDVLSSTVFGIESSNEINGHRFHGQARVVITHANEYENTLVNQYVVASFEKRVATIQASIDKQANELGYRADYDTSLLEEIASLVEWPKVMSAKFDQEFLSVPKEALIYTMKDDQKYIPLLDDNGGLVNTFLFVANIDSSCPDKVVQGNERVIRPRLADAQFFFNKDKQSPLEEKADRLNSVLFQKQLGTLKDKTTRLKEVSSGIAKLINSDSELAKRAAFLSKADLLTNMVMEFPEVQGVMGKYYAQNDGEDESVCSAIEEQYLPRYAGGKLAATATGISLSIADKLDTLVGIFGIGQLPKGDKDPFALRRNAVGLLRTIIENNLDLSLFELIGLSKNSYEHNNLADNQAELLEFIFARFKFLLTDQGFKQDSVMSVAVLAPEKPLDFVQRVKAVEEFKKNPSCEALVAANKRVANILKKNKVESGLEVNSDLFENDFETKLDNAIRDVLKERGSSITHKENLGALANLRPVIDEFFDNVMVMADNLNVRNNRLALLNDLRSLFLSTADISQLA